ncbi:MAG TPA: heme exporter protein CcmB [Bryobacteraceae bacterium]|nr:heme exporter protein CcmB [Bryobacteraceae bacterium]
MTQAGSIEITEKPRAAAAPRARAGFLRQAFAVAAKDLRSEMRSKESVNASLSFALVILLLFSLAFDPGSDQVREIAGGLLWLVFAFASALILNRSFARELVNDCLDMLISSPISAAQLFLGKAMANFVLLIVIECLCLPVFGIFYNVTWARRFGLLFLVLVLGTWGLTVIGTLFSAMTVNLRLRELMLPTLVYPLIVPVLMGTIQLSMLLINGEPIGQDNQLWFRLLVAFDVIFTILSVAVVETVLVG